MERCQGEQLSLMGSMEQLGGSVRKIYILHLKEKQLVEAMKDYMHHGKCKTHDKNTYNHEEIHIYLS